MIRCACKPATPPVRQNPAIFFWTQCVEGASDLRNVWACGGACQRLRSVEHVWVHVVGRPASRPRLVETWKVQKQTNKRTARRHVRTHGTKHANRTKDDTRTRGHGPTDGRTRVKSSQTTRSTSGAPHTSATPKLRRVPPAIDIPLNSAVNLNCIHSKARLCDTSESVLAYEFRAA